MQMKLKRDLHRAKEVNLKLAAKATKLEAQAYSGKGKEKGTPSKKGKGDASEDEE